MNVVNDDGTPFDTTGLTITCGLRNTQYRTVAQLPLVPTGETGQFSIAAASDSWPLGRLLGDFRVVNGLIVVYSSTFGLTLIESMTGP
jgi:hypothetical protein